MVELVENDELIEKKKLNRFSKVIHDTRYESYSLYNKSSNDNFNFIQKKTGNSRCCFSFIFDGNKFGVWLDNKEGKFFVSKSIDENISYTYALSLSDHSPNTMLLRKSANSAWMKMFIESYRNGEVFFESMTIKNITLNAIKIMIM